MSACGFLDILSYCAPYYFTIYPSSRRAYRWSLKIDASNGRFLAQDDDNQAAFFVSLDDNYYYCDSLHVIAQFLETRRAYSLRIGYLEDRPTSFWLVASCRYV